MSGAHFDAGTGNACDERAGKWDGWQFNGRAIDIRPLYRNIYPRARLAQKFKLSEETLFLSVDYVDRYMCTIPLENSGLKLLAVVSLLVASKVAEINDLVPSIWELRELCHNVYCRREIVAFERNLLLSLKYHLNVPTARSAIELMHCHSSSDACAVDLSYASQTLFRSLSLAHTHPWTAHARGRYRRSHYLALTSAVPPRVSFTRSAVAKYLLELGISQYAGCRYKPSELASAAVYLTRASLRMEVAWPAELSVLTGYSPVVLWPAVLVIHDAWKRSTRDSRVWYIVDKYRDARVRIGLRTRSPPPLALDGSSYIHPRDGLAYFIAVPSGELSTIVSRAHLVHARVGNKTGEIDFISFPLVPASLRSRPMSSSSRSCSSSRRARTPWSRGLPSRLLPIRDGRRRRTRCAPRRS